MNLCSFKNNSPHKKPAYVSCRSSAVPCHRNCARSSDRKPFKQDGRTVDLDTVVVTPKMKWFVDSMCISMEVREHRERLVKFTKMPDLYFTNFNKRLQTSYTRAELISEEKEKIAVALNKYPFYRKAYEATLVATK